VTRRALSSLLLASLCAVACAGFGSDPDAENPYVPDRRDYASFREGYPGVLEPNYLPFMVHRFPLRDGRGDALVFCRWADADMPLAVYVARAAIPDDLQDEFDPKDPAIYTRAIERALASWERELEGLVRFRLVAHPREARLVVRLLGERAPVPAADVKILGMTPLRGACRANGWYPDSERMRVSFSVPELKVFVADEFGLLSDDQVEWIALHEIGHALGMRSHSPIPADLMYEVVRDRVQVRELSAEDVNSFVSLYRLPNGAVFGRAENRGQSRPSPQPPSGPPLLDAAPFVDPRLGFSLRLPAGWMRFETGQGMVAVDGVTWDYTASFQVVVHRYDTIDDFLNRYTPYYLEHSRLLHYESIVVNGRRAIQARLESRYDAYVEEVTFIESGDGRVVVVTGDCPPAHLWAYRPWFQASLATLQIWDFPEDP
jgi:hypothetical protein